ncbi:MAG: hypothetical protein Q9227_004088 [Pyrenula ochraceoflavens]
MPCWKKTESATAFGNSSLESPFLNLPPELRREIYMSLLFSPGVTFHLKKTTYFPPGRHPRPKGSLATLTRQIRSQNQLKVLRDFSIPCVSPREKPEGYEPPALQLRLVNSVINAEVSALLYDGGCEAAILNIAIDSDFLNFLQRTLGPQTSRAVRALRRDQTRMKGHGPKPPTDLEIVHYIRRWRRLRFMMAESRLTDDNLSWLTLLFKESHTQNALHPVLDFVVTGFDEYYLDYGRDSHRFYPELVLTSGALSPAIIQCSYLQPVRQTTSAQDTEISPVMHPVPSFAFRGIPPFAFYMLGFSASLASCEVRGTYLAMAATTKLQDVVGREPPPESSVWV